jgi:hypothetical protein
MDGEPAVDVKWVSQSSPDGIARYPEVSVFDAEFVRVASVDETVPLP